MKPSVKIALYVVLVLGVVFCAWGFLSHFHSTTDQPPEEPSSLIDEPQPVVKKEGTGAMMTYGAFALAFLLGLGLLIALDTSRYFASKTEEFLFTDGGEALRDPGYEEAEQLWANGQHLEAIQLMRDHLERHPSHQYVSIRIAEIYEKDLGNHLAAALEYEQILKHKLEPERWGWAAIHLVNLYSGKLGKAEQAQDLLRRILRDFGQTAAAKKARERLGEQEPAVEVARASETSEASKLPRGFRPKKG